MITLPEEVELLYLAKNLEAKATKKVLQIMNRLTPEERVKVVYDFTSGNAEGKS